MNNLTLMQLERGGGGGGGKEEVFERCEWGKVGLSKCRGQWNANVWNWMRGRM